MTEPETCGEGSGAISWWLQITECGDGFIISTQNSSIARGFNLIYRCDKGEMW